MAADSDATLPTNAPSPSEESDPFLKQPPVGPQSGRAQVRGLLFFFALVYAVEGLCEPRGLIGQPLTYFVKVQYGWSPTLISSYMSLFSLPWMIKPLYGLLSDFVPVLGYRRKSYLMLANLFACVAYLIVSQTTNATLVCGALFVTFFGMAVSSTVCGALLVENGQRLQLSGALVSQQWLSLSIAAIVSSAAGGWLTEKLVPAAAIHASAVVLALGPLAILCGGTFLIAEQKISPDAGQARTALENIWSALKSGHFLAIGIFLFLYMYSPGLYVPLYFHMTNNLQFSQQFIGTLGAIGSGGSVLGAVFYKLALKGLSTKTALNLSILLGTLAALSYLLLQGEGSAALVYFFNGVVETVALIVSITLAADYSPPGLEGFSLALLASIENLAIRLSDVSGSYFYEHWAGKQFAPLVMLSAAITALAFAFVPMLRLGPKMQGQTAGAGPLSANEESSNEESST